MTSNKNLFYKLYSTPNNVINSGYTCNSAIDENDTSFDLMLHQQLTREQACLVVKRMYDKITDCMAAEVAKRMFAALKLKLE